MPITAGTRLGSYEILGSLGAGGMGEVYRARDTHLKRDVAIKVLPDLFVADPDRAARFAREAQALAALNHPNIAAIYGLEQSDGTMSASRTALVMELVDGADLSALIARGPIPIDEALPIARQLADALETAHERGIIHRDLKPGNVKVRADGTVKVLDFGLAKALDSQPGSDNMLASPTMTARATQAGVVMGTAAYMAPEQAKGKPVDRRADVWAFGCVLFEMLSGTRPFDGDDISSVVASVLRDEPKWSALPADLPPSLSRLLRRSLEKDPKRRLNSLGDARLDLDDAARGAAVEVAAASAAGAAGAARGYTTRWSAPWLWALGGAAVAAAAMFVVLQRPTTSLEPPATRLSILPPSGKRLYPDSAAVALSPDGRMAAFMVGAVSRSESELWVRSLDTMAARRIDAAESAILPFWSPDSTRVAFFSGTKLMVAPIAGGRAESLADAPGGRGGTWSGETIVYAPDAMGPLYKVSTSGGAPAPATTLDANAQERGHRFPSFLPDGEHFLYAVVPGKNGHFNIFAGSLRDDSKTLIGTFESAPVYAEPGYLLYTRQGVLMAAPFDTRALKVTGNAVALPDEPASILEPAISWTAGHTVSVANTGALAYYSAASQRTVATWYDSAGVPTGTLPLPPAHYDTIAISPDGTRGVVVKSLSPSESSLWLVDLARGGATPLSSGPGRNDAAVWSPDGTRVVWTSNRDGVENFYIKSVNDAAPEQLLYSSPTLFKSPVSWSPDGKWIIAIQLDPVTAQNVWRIDPNGREPAATVVQNPGRDIAGHVSPDSNWITFAADDSGRYELYVQGFPEAGRRTQVSSDGGGLISWWTPDGRQIVFLGNDLRSLWRVDVTPGAGSLSVGTPRMFARLPNDVVNVAAMPDRRRFIAIAPETSGTGSITIVQHWRVSQR
jgi:Tol biopolymer transport system component